MATSALIYYSHLRKNSDMATAGSATQDTDGGNIYDDTDGCTKFKILVTAASVNPALVNVPGLHDAGEFFPIPIGKDATFRLNDLGIRKVFVKGSGGDVDIEFGVVSKTTSYG